MVKSKKSNKSQIKKGRTLGRPDAKINKIKANTQYEFTGKNLTPFGGLLPLATMLEKIGFKHIIENTITVNRQSRKYTIYQYLLTIFMALFIGLERISHIVAISKDKLAPGIIKLTTLPQITSIWRFVMVLRIFNEKPFLSVNHQMMERVWQSANIKLKEITLDHDTTVNTIYGHQQGGRKGYNPKGNGKRSYQPIFTFISETGEYLCGKQRPGDTMSGEEIARHIDLCFKNLPPGVKIVKNRADGGFFCKEAVEAFERNHGYYIIVADVTSAIRAELDKGTWQEALDGDGVTEFFYRPSGWKEAKKFQAIRYQKETKEEQPSLFESETYTYRVFVTNLDGNPKENIDFYDGRASAENLIAEANNEAGIAAVPSGNFIANKSFFQMVMLSYNFNRWLHLFALKEGEEYKKRTLRTFRLHFLFIAARIARHSGQLKIRFSEDFRFTHKFNYLLGRLRKIVCVNGVFKPVVMAPFVYID